MSADVTVRLFHDYWGDGLGFHVTHVQSRQHGRVRLGAPRLVEYRDGDLLHISHVRVTEVRTRYHCDAMPSHLDISLTPASRIELLERCHHNWERRYYMEAEDGIGREDLHVRQHCPLCGTHEEFPIELPCPGGQPPDPWCGSTMRYEDAGPGTTTEEGVWYCEDCGAELQFAFWYENPAHARLR